MRYISTGRYWSSLCARYGTGWFSPGMELDLSETQAAEFNRDRAGILVPAAVAAPPPAPKVPDVVPAIEPEPEPEKPAARSFEAPPANRRVGRPPKRRDVDGDGE